MDKNYDPRAVIKDAFHIEGISAPECRSIFLDWALEPRSASTLRKAADALLKHYAPQFPKHPMTSILAEATVEISTAPKRRGGHKARG